jgi:hypothetical protein
VSVFGFDDQGNAVSWVPGRSDFLNSLTELKPYRGYLLSLSSPLTLDDFAPSIQPNVVAGAKFFVDSVNGNDSNNGLTPATAFRSLSKVATAANGTTIYLARESYWREELIFDNNSNMSFIAYGSGAKPVIDGSDIAPTGLFTADTTHTNTFRINWNLATNYPPNSPMRISVWENDIRMKRVFSADDCNTTPGSFHVVGQESGSGNMSSLSNSTTYQIYVRPFSGGVAGKVYDITKRLVCLSGGNNALVDGIHGKKAGINDGSIRVFYDSNVKNCVAEHGTKHNFYIQSGATSNCVAYKSGDPDCIPFIAFTPTRTGVDFTYDDCIAFRDLSDPTYSNDTSGGWGSHGIGGSTIVRRIDIRNCEAYNFRGGIGSEAQTFVADNCYVERCGSGIQPSAPISTNISDCEVKDCAVGVAIDYSQGTIDISNSKFYGYLYGVFNGFTNRVNNEITITNCVFESGSAAKVAYGVYLGGFSQLTMFKNIFSNNLYSLQCSGGQDISLINNSQNVYWHPTAQGAFAGTPVGAGYINASLAQWQSIATTDLDSVFANPKFAIAAPVFSLQGDSPAIALGAGLISSLSAQPPVVTLAAPKVRLINEPLTVTAIVTGGTLTTLQFRADGVSIGAADTAVPYSVAYTPTTKGVKQLSAVATSSEGQTITAANYSITVFDRKIMSGSDGAGTSLVASTGDYVLFDNNQAAGGLPATAELFISGSQVGVLNYTTDAYNSKPFVFYRSSNNSFYSGTIAAGTVNLTLL